jgi:hypothetical protein
MGYGAAGGTTTLNTRSAVRDDVRCFACRPTALPRVKGRQAHVHVHFAAWLFVNLASIGIAPDTRRRGR